MKQLIATRQLRYAGATYEANQPFEATEKDAKVLIAILKAKEAGAAKRAPVYVTAAVKAEEPPAPLDEPAPRARRGRYRTAVLKPEE